MLIRIAFTGGGTGGHIFPHIAVSRSLLKIAEKEGINLRFYYIGPAIFNASIFENEGINVRWIRAGKFRRYMSFLNIIDLFKIGLGFIESLWYLWRIMPDVIFSKGGYGALPVALAAWVYRIPILIHESDAIPGMVNKISSRWAKKIAISFDRTKNFFPLTKTNLIGLPIRTQLLDQNKNEAKKNLGLDLDRKVVLVTGGSQGSSRINDFILDILPDLTRSYELIQVSGVKDYERVLQEGKIMISDELRRFWHLVDFLDESSLADAYAAADIIISRSGASSIFEIASVGLPSILIPLPESAQDHQKENAYEYARVSGATVLEETNLKSGIILTQIEKILNDPALSRSLQEKSKNFSNLGAADAIAAELLDLAKANS
ncbi:MAG: undecaprenyldiphospho-muramoylpentapeptide beta-N-acetylglucosaminyltransferase [Parcubacteria group bacterium]|nr:undecaprenyldiphospho-muramoylpentapeptide beta-N-acetylglucosaminyltransferase [Parcubacteria group bacterium]